MRKRLPPTTCFGIVTILLLAGSSEALAQRGYYGPAYGPPPQPVYYAPAYGGAGYHQHDGFYLNFTLGLGYMRLTERFGETKDTITGTGVTFTGAAGGVVAPNLAVFGQLSFTSVNDPTWKRSGPGADAGTLYDTDATMVGIGPGVVYYLQPINLYLSGSLVFTTVTFTDTSTSDEYDNTDVGVGFNFLIGKEWWVTRDWGLGVAGHLEYARMSHEVFDYSTHMNATVLSILFTATYN